MWVVSSKSKELAVGDTQKTIMLGFGFDSKACAPGADEVSTKGLSAVQALAVSTMQNHSLARGVFSSFADGMKG